MKTISEMTNEELNEALAVEVMGWNKGCILGGYPDYYCWSDEINEEKYHWSWMEEIENEKEKYNAVMECSEWQPTTDLNQAFEVLEKYINKDNTRIQTDTLEGNFWEVRIFRYGEESGYLGRAVEKSLALAICEAALQAVRKER